MDVLLALLDAYEVTRDEGMLQEVLDVVSGPDILTGGGEVAGVLLLLCRGGRMYGEGLEDGRRTEGKGNGGRESGGGGNHIAGNDE